MRCLSYDKEFDENSNSEELKSLWHDTCIKKFFNMKTLPDLDFSNTNLNQIIDKNISEGILITGVQKKLSLQLSGFKHNNRLTLLNYPTGYIVKPQSDEYKFLPEAEYLIMMMAKKTGIKTVPFALLKDKNNNLVYITKRIDRKISRNKIEKFAMEDFCQLDNRETVDKYRGSYERCAKIINKYSIEPILDISELFLRLVFSFAVGNSDMHLKSFSLIEKEIGKENFHLSEAYDMLCTNIIIKEDKEEMALTLNGKKKNLHRNDFLLFATSCNLNKKAAINLIEKVISLQETYIMMVKESYIDKKMKEDLMDLIIRRIDRLRPNKKL